MYLFCLLLALNTLFVKFIQVAAGISNLFLYIAVHYLQIHNLPFVKDILVVSSIYHHRQDSYQHFYTCMLACTYTYSGAV